MNANGYNGEMKKFSYVGGRHQFCACANKLYENATENNNKKTLKDVCKAILK